MFRIYIVRDREAGNPIEAFFTREEATKYIRKAEKEDQEEGVYTPNFYEVAEYQLS